MTISLSPLAIHAGTPVVGPREHHLWPDITQADREAVATVLKRGILSGASAPENAGLQKEWARYCGTRHCLATNSGTAALHCAVVAAGVKPGDEVIVPALSFSASAYAVAHHGAVPVFCDIDPRTFNLTPDAVEARIGERTTAVMAVHLHGLPADMGRLMDLAEHRGLAVVEDAAQAHGAKFGGRRVGTFGRCGAFSLNATKNLVGGEGGLLVTDDEHAIRVARRLALLGEDPARRRAPGPRDYLSHGLGWNYRASEMASALARSQLRRLDEVNFRARANADRLRTGLGKSRGLIVPLEPPGCESVWNKFRVRIDCEAIEWPGDPAVARDAIVEALLAEGVAVGLWQTQPLPAMPAMLRGELAPWVPRKGDTLAAQWDPELHPVASAVTRDSFVIGTERAPIMVQSADLMERYVLALERVMAQVDRLLPAAGHAG